jgi:hypothetical protein
MSDEYVPWFSSVLITSNIWLSLWYRTFRGVPSKRNFCILSLLLWTIST